MSDHAAELGSMRKEKDSWFKTSPHSPIEDRGSFKGLHYFEPTEALRVTADWVPSTGHKHVTIGTSTGDSREYHEAGTLRFRVGGIEQTLKGYVSHGTGEDELFIPFRDATSGKETYGAGRYLEFPRPHAGHAVIDFNFAYNPYCAYSEAYSCPLPPRDNWLTVPITAGEKIFEP